MAKQAIGIGTTADDGTGDTLRAGGDKINDNFDELYENLIFQVFSRFFLYFPCMFGVTRWDSFGCNRQNFDRSGQKTQGSL